MSKEEKPFIDSEGFFTRGLFKGRRADEVRPSYIDWLAEHKPTEIRRVPQPEPLPLGRFSETTGDGPYSDWRQNPHADTSRAREARAAAELEQARTILAVAGVAAVAVAWAFAEGIGWVWRKLPS